MTRYSTAAMSMLACLPAVTACDPDDDLRKRRPAATAAVEYRSRDLPKQSTLDEKVIAGDRRFLTLRNALTKSVQDRVASDQHACEVSPDDMSRLFIRVDVESTPGGVHVKAVREVGVLSGSSVEKRALECLAGKLASLTVRSGNSAGLAPFSGDALIYFNIGQKVEKCARKGPDAGPL